MEFILGGSSTATACLVTNPLEGMLSLSLSFVCVFVSLILYTLYKCKRILIQYYITCSGKDDNASTRRVRLKESVPQFMGMHA